MRFHAFEQYFQAASFSREINKRCGDKSETYHRIVTVIYVENISDYIYKIPLVEGSS